MENDIDTEKTPGIENNTDEKEAKTPGQWLTYLISAVFAVLICALTAALVLTGNLGAIRHSGVDATEKPFFTPVPQPTPEKPPETPGTETTAAPAETETPKPEGFVKTTVFVDGTAEATLASRQAAEEMVKNAVAHFENLCMTSGLVTTIKNKIEFKTADASENVISYDEAYNIFIGKNSPLTVESKTSFIEFESIAHKTEITESELYYIGTRMVKFYGRDGKSMRVSEYTYINGVLAETAVLEEKELYPPVDEIITTGTAEIPEGETPDPEFGKADCPRTELKFNFPVQAEIVKLFGFYSGVMYNGIDFAAAEGTICKASCAGTVLSVLERGSRGLTVDLLHETGFITRYAGLSKVNVSVGDTVADGEILGSVGSKKLHFEILFEARPRNPRIYLLGLFEEP